jgi:hypothetical protein
MHLLGDVQSNRSRLPSSAPSGDEFMILQTIGVYEIIQHHFKLIG